MIKHKINLRKIIAIAICLAGTTTFAQEVKISTENFPDDNFRNWILEQEYGKDAILSFAEIIQIKNINVSNKKIADLTGIEFFAALETLNCSGNHLIYLDVSKERFPNLKTLSCDKQTRTLIFPVSDNNVYNLAITLNKNVSFETKTITYVNGILKSTSSDTTSVFSAPTGFKIKNNDGDSVHVNLAGTLNLELQGIAINSENFPDENFRNWILAQSYGSGNNLSPKEIKGITSIAVSNQNIADLSGIELFDNLKTLNCSNNNLKSLDITLPESIETLNCSGNYLTSLDASSSRFPKLKTLSCASQSLILLTPANSKGCSIEITLDENITFGINQKDKTPVITYADRILTSTSSDTTSTFSVPTGFKNDKGEVVNLTGTLTLELTGVAINSENFPDENFRNWILAQKYGNGNDNLSPKELEKITKIDIVGKGIDSLKIADLTGIEYFTGLVELYCGDNNLTSLDVSMLKNLKFLSCYDNKNLTTLDVTGLEKLEYLHVSNAKLSALDVSTCKNLSLLNCINNELTFLNVSGAKKLELLDCYNNQLTTLNVAGLENLATLRCYNNLFTVAPDVSGLEKLTTFEWRTITSIEFANANRQIIGFCTIMGVKLTEEPQSGIYIILYDNGTAEKVMKRQ
ncbi:MAG: hypothetical protein FWC39_12590 [Bacteroidetes bacterium]|nr:hypothetical protein [Bacteroidota bacterium]